LRHPGDRSRNLPTPAGTARTRKPGRPGGDDLDDRGEHRTSRGHPMRAAPSARGRPGRGAPLATPVGVDAENERTTSLGPGSDEPPGHRGHGRNGPGAIPVDGPRTVLRWTASPVARPGRRVSAHRQGGGRGGRCRSATAGIAQGGRRGATPRTRRSAPLSGGRRRRDCSQETRPLQLMRGGALSHVYRLCDSGRSRHACAPALRPAPSRPSSLAHRTVVHWRHREPSPVRANTPISLSRPQVNGRLTP